MSLEEERRRENMLHRYHFLYLVLSRVGVLALFVVTLLLTGFYRPSYNAVDVAVILAVGMMLGVIYMRSQDKLQEHYAKRLAEAGKKKATQMA